VIELLLQQKLEYVQTTRRCIKLIWFILSCEKINNNKMCHVSFEPRCKRYC